MYAVIFKATVKQLDNEYSQTAKRMRELAMEKYGCINFVSNLEGKQEIAISYWETEEQILAWKQDKEHLKAQQLGSKKWYSSYSVEITEIKRSYSSN